MAVFTGDAALMAGLAGSGYGPADVKWVPVAGYPFSGSFRYKDCGDGTFAPITVSISGNPPIQSLTGASSAFTTPGTGPGAVLDNTGVRNNHSIVVVTSAGVTTGTVVLDGSQDGVNWFSTPLSSVSTTSASAVLTATPVTLTPVRFLKARISVVISGGTIMAWIQSA
jgi:hypothetical protein